MAFLSGGAMLPRNSLNLGLASISPTLKMIIASTAKPIEVGRAEDGQRDDHEHRAHQHAGGGPHLRAQPGEQEAGEHDHAGVDVDDALRLDGLPVFVHAEEELPERRSACRPRRRGTAPSARCPPSPRCTWAARPRASGTSATRRRR